MWMSSIRYLVWRWCWLRTFILPTPATMWIIDRTWLRCSSYRLLGAYFFSGWNSGSTLLAWDWPEGTLGRNTEAHIWHPWVLRPHHASRTVIRIMPTILILKGRVIAQKNVPPSIDIRMERTNLTCNIFCRKNAQILLLNWLPFLRPCEDLTSSHSSPTITGLLPFLSHWLSTTN